MEFDVEDELSAVERPVPSTLGEGQDARAVALSRSYATTVEDLWDAVTNGERLPRSFLPISGELVLGGRYQLDGNAGGVITACARPSHLALTWEFGGDVSWVEVRFAESGAGARLALTHTAHLSEHWDTYGPGAVGVGWELGLLGLAIHLAQPAAPKPDEAAFAASPDGKAFIAGSSEAWAQAAIAAGTDPDAAHAAARRTTAFYTGESDEAD
ncbi:MAG: SRPBCC family protein [Spirochaetaceae bacterium]|nr:SRPBCC family protein [Spirochaetaceae bacterium]